MQKYENPGMLLIKTILMDEYIFMYLNIMKVILYSSLFNAFTCFMKLALLFAEKMEIIIYMSL